MFNCGAIEAKDLLPPFTAQILDNISVFVVLISSSHNLFFGLQYFFPFNFDIQDQLLQMEGSQVFLV